MKPLIYSAGTPTNLDTDFSIGWEQLIRSGMTIEKETGIGYLEAIKTYCNNDGIPDGICASVFEYRPDPEFEKLLDMIHGLPRLQEPFITYLFTKTAIRDHLRRFAADDQLLASQLDAAKFTFFNSFAIEGELSYFLYRYGMYRFFYQDHTAAEAVALTKSFTQMIYQADPGNVVCFTTRAPWGEWFDRHSCSDYTFVFINKKEHTIWLFCFSHSD